MDSDQSRREGGQVRNAVLISPDVLDVLDKSTIDGHVLKLTMQLDRKLYESVNKILTVLGGKWNRSKGGHVFDEDPSDVVYNSLALGYVIDSKKAFQQFFTPDSVADVLVDFANIGSAEYVLEPSAGQGAIARAISRRSSMAHITAVEIDPTFHVKLKECCHQVAICDFLCWDGSGLYDAVVMNPPFTNCQDVKHVREAWEYLRPGGSLTAITSPGWTFRSDRLCTEFRAWLEADGGFDTRELDAGAFSESGTDIRTVMIRKVKPS